MVFSGESSRPKRSCITLDLFECPTLEMADTPLSGRPLPPPPVVTSAAFESCCCGFFLPGLLSSNARLGSSPERKQK